MKKKLMFDYDLQMFAESNEDQDDNVDATEDESNNDDQSNNTGSSDEDNQDKGKTFSQEQLNKMMTREKNQGRNSILRELGLNPKDKNALEKVKELIASQKSDEQLAAEAKAESERLIQEAEDRAILAEAKAEAMMAGIKPQYVEDAVTLAMAKISDDTDLKTILVEFKTKYSIWFEETEEEKKKGSKIGQMGTGSSIKPIGKEGAQNDKSLGARLAAQRKASNNVKSSFWGNNK